MAHTHTITDHDDHFIIDPITRKIQPETPTKNKLVRQDHRCERYTFEIPRYIEGHDVAQCDSVRIHYLNISSNNIERNADVYEVDDLGVLENDSETAAFTWLISSNATMYAGSLSFAIEFKCITDEIVTYAWHTEIYSSISISDVITNDQSLIEEYSDILEEWKNDLFGIGDTVEQRLRNTGTEQIDAVSAKGTAVLNSIPEDYGSLHIGMSALTYLTAQGYICNPVKTTMLSDTDMWLYTDAVTKKFVHLAKKTPAYESTKSIIIKLNLDKKYIVVAARDPIGYTNIPFVVGTAKFPNDTYLIKTNNMQPAMINDSDCIFMIDCDTMPEDVEYLNINSIHGDPIVFELVSCVSEEHKILASEVSALPYFARNGFVSEPFVMDKVTNSAWKNGDNNQGSFLVLGESSYDLSGVKFEFPSVAARVKVYPGERYYIKTYISEELSDTVVQEISPYRVVGAYNDLGRNAELSSDRYEIRHDYTYDISAKQSYNCDYTNESHGDISALHSSQYDAFGRQPSSYDYVIDIPSDINFLLVNSFSKDYFPVIKKLSNPNTSIIDLTDSKYDVNTFYPITGTSIPKGGLHKIHVYSTFDDGAHPSWATNAAGYTCNMEVLDKAQTWGQTDGATICTDRSWKHTDKSPCGYIQMTHSSTPVILLRGGGIYHIKTDYASEWTIHTDVYTYQDDTVRPIAYGRFDFDRATIFANVDGNVTGTVNGHTLGTSVPEGASFIAVRDFSAPLAAGAADPDFDLHFIYDVPVVQGYTASVAILEQYLFTQSDGAQIQIVKHRIYQDEYASRLELTIRNIGTHANEEMSFPFKILYVAI